MYKKIELLANIAIIVAAVLLVALAINKFLLSPVLPAFNRRDLQAPNTHLLSVLPQSTKVGRKYLSELSVTIEDVRQIPVNVVGVASTPTLILVDKEGTVKTVWIGKLPESAQSEVISQL